MLSAKLAAPVATHSDMQGESEEAVEAAEGEAGFDCSSLEVAGKSHLAEMSMICWGCLETADQHAAGRLSYAANINIDKLVSPGIYGGKMYVCIISDLIVNMRFSRTYR